MVRIIRARYSWKREQPLQMAGFARGTAIAMKDNSNFQNPDIALSDIDKGATRVENAWANRKNGPVAKDELKNSSLELDTNLRAQADYVTKIAKGDSTMIHSGGFESTEDVSKARAAVPEDPEAPVCTPLSGGGMKVNVKARSNVKTI